MTDNTDFLAYRGNRWMPYILPIIPAGAPLSPTSKLTPGHLGKIPGKYLASGGGWVGFADWQKHRANEYSLERWQQWQIDTGMPIALASWLGILLAIDLDINDEARARKAVELANATLGETFIVRRRVGSSRRVLLYERDQHTAPIHKTNIKFSVAGVEGHELIEVLASGEQVVLEGPHAKGAMHYWENGISLSSKYGTQPWLPMISVEHVSAFMLAVQEWVAEAPDLERVTISLRGLGGSSNSEAAVPINMINSPHQAKDLELLGRCLRAIDLDDERIDYDTFITLLRAASAACSGSIEFFTTVVWPWVCTQKVARGEGPRSEDRGIEWLEERWRSFTDSSLGFDYISQWASWFGEMGGAGAKAQEIFDGLPVSDSGAAYLVQGADGGANSPLPGGGGGNAPTGGPLAPNDTHHELALAFEAAYTNKWLYTVEAKDWLRYGDMGDEDGQLQPGIWQPAPGVLDDIRSMAATLSRQILATVNGPQGAARSRALESTGTHISVRTTLQGGRSMVIANEGKFNVDAHLLNTPDCVVDLRTGDILAHNPSYLMKHVTLVPPDVLFGTDWSRSCPRWIDFVKTLAYGRPGYEAFLQRWFGYALTGQLAKHQHFMFMQGPPGTGKSQLINTILLLANTYGISLPESWIIKAKSDKRFDMAQVVGKRLLVNDETQKGSTFDETRISTVSTAPKLHGEIKGGRNFEFPNTCKLNIVGNHRPHFTGGETGGLMRRMLLWEVVNPPIYGTDKEQDSWAEVLVREEGPGILRWALEGARQDYADTNSVIYRMLARPLSIAAEVYTHESSPVLQWIEETDMRVEQGAEIGLKAAFGMYKDYAKRAMPDRLRDTLSDFKASLQALLPALDITTKASGELRNKVAIYGMGAPVVNFGDVVVPLMPPAKRGS